MKKILIILIPLLVLILILFIFIKLKFIPAKTLSVPESPTVVSLLSSLNQPIFRFRGKIEKIENQSLIINGEPILDLPFLATNSTAQATPKLTLQVLINSSTKINNSATNSAKLSLANLKTNQTVIVSSPTDLRNLTGNEFTADSIVLLSSPIASIQGKITDIKNDILTINTTAIPAMTIPDSKVIITAQVAKTYQIIITPDTNISTGDPLNPKSLTQKDLKIDQTILIFTEDDPIFTTQITAKSVELI